MTPAVWFILGLDVGMMLGILLYHLKVLAANAVVIPMWDDFQRGL